MHFLLLVHILRVIMGSLLQMALVKADVENRLEKRETLSWVRVQDPAGIWTHNLLISSQTLLPLSYWTQVAVKCRKMVFPYDLISIPTMPLSPQGVMGLYQRPPFGATLVLWKHSYKFGAITLVVYMPIIGVLRYLLSHATTSVLHVWHI